MSFTHLHVHTEFSLLDGACRIEQLLDKVEKLGQKSIAITDHGVMYGAVDFYRAAKKRGIKPIIGCEVYVAERSRFDKVHGLDNERSHLVLLCKNQQGYQNLIAMVSEAWVNGFYTKPRIDRELLEKHHEGLIALSACLAGEVPRALMRHDYPAAKEIILWYKEIFGEDYYIEIQDHGIREQLEINPLLIRLSEETGVPLVATNDVHYIEKADARVQQVLICIQTNHTLGEKTGLEFSTNEFYLKSEDEMAETFSHIPEALENTQKIAEKCNAEFTFGETKLPHFEVPNGQDHFEYLKEMCSRGMAERYGEDVPQQYWDRLNYELDVIHNMGYVDYYLIVHDFIHYAKTQGIPVGPGRGSGAGSIAAYTIGITGIDPMKYNLLFERFLNPERVSMPDFDVDFCYERRQEVIDYVVRKYGADRVAQIITFGTLAARAAIRDVGRALGLPYAAVDRVAKQIPNELGITIDSALKKSAELKELYEDDEIKDLIDTARKVEGMPRHASTHAAGVVITRDPVASYVPLATNDGAPVTQFTMTTLEELGLLKIDFLGLRTLTVMEDARKMISKRVPDFDLNKIPIDDVDTYKLFGAGQTEGVFQFESNGMRNILMNLKPESLEDLIAVISLYRPGPMGSIPTYIENRHHPEKIRYKTELLKPIMDVTYGCLIYQEQVMQVFRELAGYSYGRADIVRRAMAKKKHKVMEEERKSFIYGSDGSDGSLKCEGAVKRGVSAEAANELFDEMSSFASYAFNKSHATAYAYVAYQTAYLKCHYPREYFAALLTSVLDRSDKVAGYIAECNKMNIPVLPPDVNKSYASFTVAEDGIRFGLLAIKNLGSGFIRSLVEERERDGKFTAFYSFCKRTYGKDFNRRAVEGLIKSGSLDSMNLNRRQMLIMLPEVISTLESDRQRNVDGQIGFFGTSSVFGEATGPAAPPVDEFHDNEKLRLEKESAGLYLTGHPMASYREMSEKVNAAKVSSLLLSHETGSEYNDGDTVLVLGLVSSVRRKVTKKDETMAFIVLEDLYGVIEVMVFPRVYRDYFNGVQEGSILLLRGRLSVREDENVKIVCDYIKEAPPYYKIEEAITEAGRMMQGVKKGNQTYKKSAPAAPNPNKQPEHHKRQGLFLRLPSKGGDKMKLAERVTSIFDGTLPVYYYYLDTKTYERQPYDKWVTINEPMVRELKRILGDENVVIQL